MKKNNILQKKIRKKKEQLSKNSKAFAGKSSCYFAKFYFPT